MTAVNISTYKFIELTDLPSLKERFLMAMHQYHLNGTILIAREGINICVVGGRAGVDGFGEHLSKDTRFADMRFKESYSEKRPFRKKVVKIKDEIIAMNTPEVEPQKKLGQHISPKEFKQWLDEERDVAILDTRNYYEVDFGTFKGAIDPKISTFKQFPAAVDQLDEKFKEKPVVMFCTGGVRCEKASILMEQKGFKNVYQIEGGILKYFEECGDAHWQGDCFVFDDRISLNAKLEITGDDQCHICQHRIAKEDFDSPDYVINVSCPVCINQKQKGA
jgi:UPF0176 protein